MGYCEHGMPKGTCALHLELVEPYEPPQREGRIRVRYEVDMHDVERILATRDRGRPHLFRPMWEGGHPTLDGMNEAPGHYVPRGRRLNKPLAPEHRDHRTPEHEAQVAKLRSKTEAMAARLGIEL